MKIARVQVGDEVFLARIESTQARLLAAESRSFGSDALREALAESSVMNSSSGDLVDLEETTLLAPVTWPQKILAVALNYADHAREAGLEMPTAPVFFAKTPNSLIGTGGSISWFRSETTRVDYEAELAVVIGSRARRVSPDEALNHVFGYTCCNDVSARDAQLADGQFVRGKSFDTFCPLGPWIITTDEIGDPQSLGIWCRINGEIVQQSTTAEMVFSVADLISYLSRFLTLEPGDVIATGTPFGVGVTRDPPLFLQKGDTIEVEIERIGILTNQVLPVE